MTTNDLSPELLLQIRKETREQAVTFIDAYTKGKELEYKEKQLQIMNDMMLNLRWIRNRLGDIGENLQDENGYNVAEVLREMDKSLIGCF